MNWRQVKIFLILLLAVVNLLLFYLTANFYAQRSFISEDTAVRAAALLKDSGIDVSAELLRVQNDQPDTWYCDYVKDDYLYLTATMLFGAEPSRVYLLPDGMRAESADGAVVRLCEDLSVLYTAKETGADEWRTAFENAAETGRDTEAEQKILEKLLFLESGSLTGTSFYAAGERLFAVIAQSQAGIPVSGMECVFGFSGGTLCYAEGNCFFMRPAGMQSAPILNRINILFSEKASGMRGTVSRIELCYALYESAKESRMYYIPSYTVFYADGAVSVVNALSGEKYQ